MIKLAILCFVATVAHASDNFRFSNHLKIEAAMTNGFINKGARGGFKVSTKGNRYSRISIFEGDEKSFWMSCTPKGQQHFERRRSELHCVRNWIDYEKSGVTLSLTIVRSGRTLFEVGPLMRTNRNVSDPRADAIYSEYSSRLSETFSVDVGSDIDSEPFALLDYLHVTLSEMNFESFDFEVSKNMEVSVTLKDGKIIVASLLNTPGRPKTNVASKEVIQSRLLQSLNQL